VTKEVTPERPDRVCDSRIVTRSSSDGIWFGGRREGDCGDFNPRVDGVPRVKCRIELFCNREDGKVPVGCR